MTDLFAPYITSKMINWFLLFIILLNYLRTPSSSSKSAYQGGYYAGPGFPALGNRDAAYEQLWYRAEADLWDWMDQRIDVSADAAGARGFGFGQREGVKAAKKGNDVKQQVLRDAKMTEREVEAAILATKQKLMRLEKSLLGDKKEGGVGDKDKKEGAVEDNDKKK